MRKKAGVLGSISFQIRLTKEKERAKRKKRGEEKRAMDALLVFIMATLAGKKFWTQKLHLVVMLSKIRLDMLQEKQRKLKQVILLHCNIAISL